MWILVIVLAIIVYLISARQVAIYLKKAYSEEGIFSTLFPDETDFAMVITPCLNTVFMIWGWFDPPIKEEYRKKNLKNNKNE
jgi:hypothetical protein